MPDVRGDEVCRQVRQRDGYRHIPIVIFSSLADAELAVLAKKAGANGFVSKQNGLDTVREYVQRLVVDGVL
jgi:two-component system chemotaxis response regulator CheV